MTIPNYRPFLKWPGGKRRLVPLLASQAQWPARRVVEPFCGSAVFSLSIAAAGLVDEVWLNDINSDLINLFRVAAFELDPLVQICAGLFVPENNTAERYYYWRKVFNNESDPLQRAALFIYLNRHGYNGLCRFSASGSFNVPFGRYRRPAFPEAELREAAPLLRKARLTELGFEAVLEQCTAGDVVYCDPPYVPLSATASFTAYAPAAPFRSEEQAHLALCAGEAARRGATVVVSNHDTPETRQIYGKHITETIAVRRNISCKGNQRAKAAEIIAVF
ncbi:MAG TPA: DNA adenine methylase [Firmicutes bacterium]|jgi:DNA adenine methylase|nr:DNA adenine methylase [Bacillota bacterium]HAW70064.1 DNA adenine methylase [Bacillota bacterium]HAZ22846.1 DNA adenine methylase [Bacillota bacterium]HBE06388.1 DNA adenine methylase [Bacillota bacterium]HBG43824.1 DNA adenine methylase [Bacillota bacterium]